ncbi:uncharacterized protein METZ01_LOCUS255750, partial [marine metagenome]
TKSVDILTIGSVFYFCFIYYFKKI